MKFLKEIASMFSIVRKFRTSGRYITSTEMREGHFGIALCRRVPCGGAKRGTYKPELAQTE